MEEYIDILSFNKEYLIKMMIKEFNNFQSREALLKMQFDSDKEII